MNNEQQLRSSDKADGLRRNALQLSVQTKCCGSKIVVLSHGMFDKRTKGKYICPCGTFKKSLVEVVAFDKEVKDIE